MTGRNLVSRRFSYPFFPLVLSIVLTTLVLIYQLSSYDEGTLFETFKSAYHQGTNSFMNNKNSYVTKNQIIFPYNFHIKQEDLPTFIDKKKNVYNLTELNNPEVVKYTYNTKEYDSKKHLPLTQEMLSLSNYKSHNITVFHSQKNINNNLKNCKALKKSLTGITISDPVNMQVSLSEILAKFLNDYNSGKNKYFQELGPFFINELELQLKYNVVDRYWYRLAGSSVWLEQYGVHFMISRILYSPKGARNQPILSLTYGQIFDKDWKELINTKLVVPTNDLKPSMNDLANEATNTKKKNFKVLLFPQILPIPFWHDYDNTEGKYYGPEDPRILLVKNPKGHEEPLIIFNAYHRKLTHFDDDIDDHILMKTNFYRSMFMCWPWQFQKGKENTDGMVSNEYDKNYYNKVIELKIKNLPRQNKQKNWTPFISDNSKSEFGYDKYINFIYRWANLETLKCDLIGDTGSCSFTYRLNSQLSPSAKIGPLRGGTQLLNVNELLKSKHDIPSLKELLPKNREIWVGFARAHLDKCGCGNNMYRPNLVILVKDSVKIESGENDDGTTRYRLKDLYKISHVSSSISFDIPIIGWDLMNPKDLCQGSNVLIPNGISSWSVKSFTKDEKWTSEDYMTLSLSISDFTVHKIDIKGLLNEILQDKSLFIPPSADEIIRVNRKALTLPKAQDVINPNKSKYLIGFNNDNVICGLQSSTEFCSKYGVEFQKLITEDDNKSYNDIEETLEQAKSNHDSNDADADSFQYEDEEIETDIDKYEKALELQNIQDSIDNYAGKADDIPRVKQVSPKQNNKNSGKNKNSSNKNNNKPKISNSSSNKGKNNDR